MTRTTTTENPAAANDDPKTRIFAIRLTDEETAAVQRLTKVDAVATAVVAVVRRAIEGGAK